MQLPWLHRNARGVLSWKACLPISSKDPWDWDPLSVRRLIVGTELEPATAPVSAALAASQQISGLELLQEFTRTLDNPSQHTWKEKKHPPSLDHHIQRLCRQGQLLPALRALSRMDRLRALPSDRTYLVLLQACQQQKALLHAKHVHAHIARWHWLHVPIALAEHLIMTLGKCGDLDQALSVLHLMPSRTTYAWTALISSYTAHGLFQEGLSMYCEMQQEGLEADEYTFVSLLKACHSLSDLQQGKKLHSDLCRKGLQSDTYICNTLICMYGKCGNIEEAENVFIGMSQHDIVSWNAMLAAYIDEGQGESALKSYRQLQEEGMDPEEPTFALALQACGMLADDEHPVELDGHSLKVMPLEITHALHADARRKGFAYAAYMGNTLISVYGKCGTIVEAEIVFSELPKRNVVSWNVMLNTYIEFGHAEKAFRLYRQMQDESVSSDHRTLVVILKACMLLADKEDPLILEIGQALHAAALKSGFISNVFIGNSLVSMYGKCRNIKVAAYVFDRLPQPNVVSWNAMLSTYLEQGQGKEVLQLYRQMQEEGTNPDDRTIAISLKATCIIAENEETTIVEGDLVKSQSLKIGQALHADVRRNCFDSLFVQNSLMCMYGRCGSIKEAETLWCSLSQHNTTTWNMMLTMYVEQGQGDKALQLYKCIQKELIILNDVTLVCILQACHETGTVQVCKELHFAIVSVGLEMFPPLATALIHAYASFASMIDGQVVFDGLPETDTVSWNACIAGHAREGNCVACSNTLEEMQLAGVNPNRVTYLSLLTACSHAGLIYEGIKYFQSMSSDYNITPDHKHYTGMVDLLGRAGDFERMKLLQKMAKEADVDVWLSLLSVCCTHGNVELGKQAFDHVVSLWPKDAAPYVVMSNLYAYAGLEHLANYMDNSIEADFVWR